VSIFESKFNAFAAWITSGNFCHSEIVIHVDPEILKTSITKAMTQNDHGLNSCIEECFFSDAFARQQLSSSEPIYVSFAALWGMKLKARVLRSTATNAYEHTPLEKHSDVEYIRVKGIEDIQGVSDFCVMQMGKEYARFSALMSATKTECTWFHNPSKSKFCSELCVCALQQDNILEDLKPATITPNSLYMHILEWNKQKEKMENDDITSVETC